MAAAGVLAGLLFLPTKVSARQPGRREFDLFAEGGGSFFTPKSASSVVGIPGTPAGPVVAYQTTSARGSGRLFVGVDFWFTRRDALQVSYAYNPADVMVTTTPVQPPIRGGSALFTPRAEAVSFDYLRSVAAKRRWSLFLAVGLGGLWRTREASGSFVVNLGVGVELALAGPWAVRAEYRDFVMPYPGGAPGWAHNHAPTIGVVYHF